jgi:hypothetical protein
MSRSASANTCVYVACAELPPSASARTGTPAGAIDAVGKKRGMSSTGAGPRGADDHDANRSAKDGAVAGKVVVAGAAVVVGSAMMVGAGSGVAGVVALVIRVEAEISAVSLPQEAIRSTPTAAGAILIIIRRVARVALRRDVIGTVDMGSCGWSSCWISSEMFDRAVEAVEAGVASSAGCRPEA